MNARATFANLLRLGCGAFLVAMAAVWGPYARLLRVSVANERGNDVLVVAADLERAGASQQSPTQHRHAQAVSAEGETPAGPRMLKPVLDDADRAPFQPAHDALALPGLGCRFRFTDADPPEALRAAGSSACDAAPGRSGPARAPPSAW
ncbi:MAG: hypothetical protein KIS92_05395 [Planctomycetota bacterium]|nr:hypothetical protein [Planctomycetota bacterium]